MVEATRDRVGAGIDDKETRERQSTEDVFVAVHRT